METDYKNINTFEAAVVGMIAVGFVIVGIVLFAALTPRQQSEVASAFDLLDLHEQTASTAENVKFVLNAPNEFYNQFYIAFTEIAILPSATFELPEEIAAELARNFSVAMNTLADQVAVGYAAQNRNGQLTQLEYDGKIMGAVIEISDRISTVVVTEQTTRASLNLRYEYSPPKLDTFNPVLKLLTK